jgi:hypothetical protein
MTREQRNLQNQYQDASRALEQALNNPECKNDRSGLSESLEKAKEVSERIEKMVESVRGANNPAVAKLAELGRMAHQDYQNHSGECAAWEVTVGGNRADCIVEHGGECQVIELKPDSSNAMSKAREQARKVRDILNQGGQELTDAVAKWPKLAACTAGKFRARVDCYVYCPEIGDDGEMKSASIGWGVFDSSN